MNDVETGDWSGLVRELRSAGEVLIVSHRDPDGDAIGSSVGLALALESIGVRTQVLLGSGESCPETYRFLGGADRCISLDAVTQPADLAVVLDANDSDRLGRAAGPALAAGRRIVIDHHLRGPDGVGDALGASVALIDASAPATGLLIWELLPHLGVEPDAAIATALYTALLTDTGRFSFSNATSRAFRVAAEMVSAGADPNAVYMAVYESRSMAAHQLITRVLERLTVVNSGLVAYSWVDAGDFEVTGATRAEAENLIDVVRPLAGIEVAMLVKENAGSLRVSLRSKTNLDVRAVAARFGGGGHRAAAGFTFEGSRDALLGRLLPMLPGSGA